MNHPTPEGVSKRLQKLKVLRQQHSEHHIDLDAVVRYGGFVAQKIECHKVLPRAMERARELIDICAAEDVSFPSGTVILADSMGMAKGRFSRTWHAPAGGIWGCLVHANNLLPQARQFIPTAVGVACCQSVRDYVGDRATIRWVNDVLVDGKKIAGFLIESFTEKKHGEEFTLIGFGINVNNCSFPDELVDTAVSLRQLLNQETDLRFFTTSFLANLAWNFGLIYHEESLELQNQSFSGAGGTHIILETWKSLSDTIGKRVIYGFDVMTNPQYQAYVQGVDSSGGLILQLEDGNEKIEYSGEVRYLT